jgi:hypothetical protein
MSSVIEKWLPFRKPKFRTSSAPESPRYIPQVKMWLAAINNFDMLSSSGHDDKPTLILENDIDINVAAL